MMPDLYLNQGDTTTGPHRFEEVEALHAAGTITDDTECCEEGDDKWMSLRKYVEAYQASVAALAPTVHTPQAMATVSRPKQDSFVPPDGLWHLSLPGGSAGPYSFLELQSMLDRRAITPHTLCCATGATQWNPLALALPELCYPHHTAALGSVAGAAPSIWQSPPQPIILQQQGRPRHGCVFACGLLLMLVGALACFTFIGIIPGVVMMLIGVIAVTVAQ